jgi:two-component system, chemotaxis family, protein-glutamate methylesterase/glutaminase
VKASGKPVRVMIVEDSTVVRVLLTHIVERDPRLTVAAAVASAEEALACIGQVKPDVISMDIRLPGMDGLEATARIMSDHPTPIVVIADAVEDASLKISMNALRAGALTVVEKPVGLATDGYERLADTICTQLFIMSSVPVIRRRAIGGAVRAPRETTPPSPSADFQDLGYLALAASTGGPPALARVLDALPADFPAPILIVQHMGAAFMEGFASWLDGLSPIRVAVARDGELALPGRAYVAPGDRHLTLTPGGVLRLSGAAPVSGQRPSATVLFQSLARSVGSRTVAALLTGMGEDGARGLSELRAAGGFTIAEHESSAVVYGMPAAAVKLGAARAVLGLDLIGPRIAQLARRREDA